jgi:hypothetical protein
MVDRASRPYPRPKEPAPDWADGTDDGLVLHELHTMMEGLAELVALVRGDGTIMLKKGAAAWISALDAVIPAR